MPTKCKWLPSEPTQEMTMAWCANCHAWDLDAYKAMWQAAPEVEQEPVGYIYRQSDIDRLNEIGVINTLIVTTPDTGYKVPLYTHPQPKREPLSEEKINALRVEVSKEHTVSRWLLHLIIRLTEQAHGIGVE